MVSYTQTFEMGRNILGWLALLIGLGFAATGAAPASAAAQNEIRAAAADSITTATAFSVTHGPAPLVAGDPAAAAANTRAIAALLAAAPAGAAIHFPAGDYYFAGAAAPGHGTIETSQPGQTIYGDGPGVTNLIQCDPRPDFGFAARADLKRVPAATVRVRHKGCAVRALTVMADPRLANPTTLGTAALQVAHIRYFPDGNVGIVESDGEGADFLLDHVTIRDVAIGRNLGMGIVGAQFFEVGVDIVGSGGHVRVSDMDRIDAVTGIRLDNGNHCGQGEYLFRNCHMIGRPGVTSQGVFFDWVGGQAPQLEMCSSSFINGFHAGPLGAQGDRFEPHAEGKVYRAADRDWDWLTWHPHPVAAEPNPAQRMEWYGLPRQATVERIGTQPRTGGDEFIQGRDFNVETLDAPEALKGAVKIHWLGERRPAAGKGYYVTFAQPKALRVHDLQWGNLLNCSFQEANQAGADHYTAKFEDQDFGLENPDFSFRVGYGFALSHTFTINGDLIFAGCVDSISVDATTGAVCNVRLKGASAAHPATNLTFSNNRFNTVTLGDAVQNLIFDGNDFIGALTLDAPTLAREITLTRNTIHDMAGTAVTLSGSKIEGLRLQDNTLRGGPPVAHPAGPIDGLVVRGAAGGFITGNRISGFRAGAGLRLEGCANLIIRDNLLTGNARDQVGTAGEVILEKK